METHCGIQKLMENVRQVFKIMKKVTVALESTCSEQELF